MVEVEEVEDNLVAADNMVVADDLVEVYHKQVVVAEDIGS